ncbi:MAG: glutamine--tRNA ligase/YqeY domain fusion protein [Gallionella sp.]|nr:glutamine--tRNA ligase/YqeY domain fusion protein [Gallionella sp.]MDD4947038.1 glutamine--tRNA ligase/YqeY domain fusion protein [Gallionella sp.]MDD5612810.1 glutamine--tRNA ligase/YqeY domain fusion protein [Gallionella sp.]
MSNAHSAADAPAPVSNFIRTIIDNDLATGRHASIVTRFPPEPNGYLHVGHAKSICLNFGLAQDYRGQCNLRFDDTNPEKESNEYAQSIEDDVRWLGFQWSGQVHWASDYFDALYGFAVELINKGLAYVDDLTPEQMREYRGTLTQPGRNSPNRDRSVAENLDLFTRMKAGEFADGAMVLRARIDMSSPNMNMRDPAIYRIRRAHHIRTGDKWCIYPMYDYTHCISDALEGITHSICTLEFEDHRPLYDWVLDNITIPCHPRQYEFSRLELNYTITSKRKLLQLVNEKKVSGWDDPRMPTIQGMRRRGYTPEGIREFARRIGVSKSENNVDMAIMEGAIREDLETRVPRVLAVINPLKVIITNAEGAQSREAGFHPNHPEFGSRTVPFSRELLIEADDFAEVPPPGWQRLTLGGEIRLRYSYVMRCDEVVKDADGRVIELKCSIDHDTLGKNPVGRKVKGVIHYLSREHALPAEVRLYERLFTVPQPDADRDVDFCTYLNPGSLNVVQGWVESGVQHALPETRYQFERLGYFVTDRRDHQPGGKLVFNRTVTLKDSWAKEQA